MSDRLSPCHHGVVRLRLPLLLIAGIALATASLAVGSPAAKAPINRGTFTVNRGAVGARLGMTRAQVIAKLGQPLFTSQFGAMSYANGPNILDIYLDTSTTPKRVRLFVISGRKFCTATDICMFTRGGVGDLMDQYGSRLQPKTNDDGLKCYQVIGTYQGRDVFTSFTVFNHVPRSKFINVFITWGSGDVC
jgi:hypothetical protein